VEVTLGSAIQITVAGLALGSTYALLLLGVLIVYRVSRAVNFSQGQLGMASAFVAYGMYRNGAFPIWLALVLGIFFATLISLLTQRVFVERLSRKGKLEGQDLVVTLGIMLLLTASAETLLGSQTQSFVQLGTDSQFSVGSAVINANQILVFIATGLLLIVFGKFLKTRPGVAMRASSLDPDLAKSFGTNVDRVRSLTWAASGLIAGVAGIVVASRLSVDPYYMTPFLISTFIAGIIGGLDRFVMPLLIAFALALYQVWSEFLWGSNYGTASLFILIIVLLGILPKRFLAEKSEARA